MPYHSMCAGQVFSDAIWPFFWTHPWAHGPWCGLVAEPSDERFMVRECPPCGDGDGGGFLWWGFSCQFWDGGRRPDQITIAYWGRLIHRGGPHIPLFYGPYRLKFDWYNLTDGSTPQQGGGLSAFVLSGRVQIWYPQSWFEVLRKIGRKLPKTHGSLKPILWW